MISFFYKLWNDLCIIYRENNELLYSNIMYDNHNMYKRGYY